MNTLVAGSYPPIPGPAAAATLAAVREALNAGDEVEVVSPRASAAERRAVLRGWRAAAALARLSRRRERLVLVVEPGMPFVDESDRGAAAALALVARHRYRAFDVWLVQPDLVPVQPLRALWPAAGRIVVATEADRQTAVRRLGVPQAQIVIDPAALPRASLAAVDASAVTPIGPRDWTRREQPRRIASLIIRGVLGTRTDAVRARVLRAVNAARRAPGAVQQRLDRSR